MEQSKNEIEMPGKVEAHVCAVSMHLSTRQSILDELLRSTQSFQSLKRANQSGKKELFLPSFHPRSRETLKHSERLRRAVKPMDSTLVRTVKGNLIR